MVRLGRRRASGRAGAVAGLWLAIARDTAVSAAAERWSVMRGSGVTNTGFERRKSTMLDRLSQTVSLAVRRLVRAPGFAAAGILIAALGIGANTTAFSLVDALLFRPAPFADADRVVRVYQDSDGGDPSSSSYPATRDMAEFTDIFSGVAAWSPDALTWEAAEGPRPMAVEYVTASYLPVLGLEPSLGRWFEPGYDEPGAGAYAVLSRFTWETKFGADPGVVGSTIRLNGQPVTVLGVGPVGFNGSGGALLTDLWLSISSTSLSGPYRVSNLERRTDHWYQVWARLAPGVTVAQSQAAMNALAARLAETYPELNRGRDITVFRAGDIRIHPDADASLRLAGTLLMLVVGMVLILACSNLAGLLLVRGLSRSSEVAVRRALGATRGRVAGLFLVEAFILSAAGGAVGLLLARWAIRVIPSLPLNLPVAGDLRLDLDGRVLLFTLGLVILTSLLFGLVPALRSAGTDISGTLRRDVRFSTHGRRIPLFRNAMVAIQVAVSLVLLVGSGLLVHSLSNLSRADSGVDAEHVAFIQTTPAQAGIDTEQAVPLMNTLLERFGAIPGVTGVAAATRLPVQSQGGTSTTVVDGYQPPSGTDAVELIYSLVTPGYFETVGVPLRAGRAFTAEDLTSGRGVAIINESAARQFWGTTDAVGRRIRPQGAPDAWREIIGVVADTKVRTLGEPATPIVYRPLDGTVGPVFLVARTPGDATAIVDELRGELRAVNASLPVASIGTLDSSIRAGLASPRMAATVLASFSAIAVLLTGLGIYAVLAFSVARRSAELGIRMALGAERRVVVGAVVGEVLVTVVIGLLIGFGLAAFGASRVQGLLFQVDGMDPVAFGLAAGLVVVVAAFAAWMPARRAVAIDPVEALRARA